MSTISTPILQDHTFSSVSVTELFRAGRLFIKHATYQTATADEATFDNLNVTNLIVNGQVTATASDNNLSLLPSQLVATDGSGQPISFPYGSNIGDIAIRDGSGSASFTSWTTPATTNQFFFSTGDGVGINVLFNSAVNSTLTVPDVGADANVVAYSGDRNTSNVVSSGDNILNLKSTDNMALVIVGGPAVSGSTMGSEFRVAGSKVATMQVDYDTKTFSVLGPSDNVKLSILPQGTTSTVSVGGPFTPVLTLFSDLSNGSFNLFKSLGMTIGTASISNYTNTISLDTGSAAVLTLNTGNTDSMGAMASKSATWNNSFITPDTKFLISVQGLNGTINGALVGVPYVIIKDAGIGTCTVTTYNISAAQTMQRQVIVGVMMLG